MIIPKINYHYYIFIYDSLIFLFILDVFPGSQTGFYQPGGATQQTGTHYGLQGFGQHSQSLATGSAAPVGLQNFSSGFLSSSGLQIAAAAQQFRNPTGGLPGPANTGPTFLSKHQPQEQPRQLKSPSGNQQDVLASVFSSSKLNYFLLNYYGVLWNLYNAKKTLQHHKFHLRNQETVSNNLHLNNHNLVQRNITNINSIKVLVSQLW